MYDTNVKEKEATFAETFGMASLQRTESFCGKQGDISGHIIWCLLLSLPWFCVPASLFW